MKPADIPPDAPPHIRQRVDAERRTLQELTVNLCDSIRASDFSRFNTALDALLPYGRPLLSALRRAAKVPGASRAFRLRALEMWLEDGDTLRSEAADLTLADFLRAILPRYRGGPVQLYRGESAHNRSRRTYGLSWSTRRDAARLFAVNRARMYQGGTVLLESYAPPEAVICAAIKNSKSYAAEAEYLVDRRRLGSVLVLERFEAST